MKEMERKTKEQHKEDEYWKQRLERLKQTHERAEQIHELNEKLAFETYTKNMKVIIIFIDLILDSRQLVFYQNINSHLLN